MLFIAFEGYQSIREAILGLLANAHKISHLGLSYVVRRSTFSEANQRRSSKVFGDIYMSVYRKYASFLTDSHLTDKDMKRLYIMDSTTITLFKDILKGVGRNPKEGKKKNGIKAHTIIKAEENVPHLIRYSEAVRHDHIFLKEVHHLPKGSIITFDKGYVDYAQYEEFTKNSIWYVTRLKENAIYKANGKYIVMQSWRKRYTVNQRFTSLLYTTTLHNNIISEDFSASQVDHDFFPNHVSSTFLGQGQHMIFQVLRASA